MRPVHKHVKVPCVLQVEQNTTEWKVTAINKPALRKPAVRLRKESHMELYTNLLNLYGIAAPQWHHYNFNQCTVQYPATSMRWRLFGAAERALADTGGVLLSILCSPERMGNDVRPLLFIVAAYSLSRSSIDSKRVHVRVKSCPTTTSVNRSKLPTWYFVGWGFTFSCYYE